MSDQIINWPCNLDLESDDDDDDDNYSNSSDGYCSDQDCTCGDDRTYIFYILQTDSVIELWCVRDDITISHAIINKTISLTHVGSQKKPFIAIHANSNFITKVYHQDKIKIVTSKYYDFYHPIVIDNTDNITLSVPEPRGIIISVEDLRELCNSRNIRWLVGGLRGRRQF